MAMANTNAKKDEQPKPKRRMSLIEMAKEEVEAQNSASSSGNRESCSKLFLQSCICIS